MFPGVQNGSGLKKGNKTMMQSYYCGDEPVHLPQTFLRETGISIEMAPFYSTDEDLMECARKRAAARLETISMQSQEEDSDYCCQAPQGNFGNTVGIGFEVCLKYGDMRNLDTRRRHPCGKRQHKGKQWKKIPLIDLMGRHLHI